MNSDELTNFINTPEKLDTNSLPKIIEIVKRYPYFQTGQMLLAKNLYNNGNSDYNKYLHKAAAYAGSRKNFYILIHSLNPSNTLSEIKKNTEPFKTHDETLPNNKTILENKPTEPIVINQENPIIKAEIPITKEEYKSPIETIKSNPISTTNSTIESDKKAEYQRQLKLRLAEIAQESKIKNTSDNNAPISKETISQNELIDKFIKDEPRIVPQNKEIINEKDLSEKSSLDNSEIISETLAQIYEKQGNYEKAIKTYEKLSLKFPEKNTYFASQIEKIKNNYNY